ncbi:MAG: hypothetical protein ACLRWP_18435 [Bilophila wadsworthia]
MTVNPGTTFRTLTPELVRLGAVRNADKFILLLRWMNYRDIPTRSNPDGSGSTRAGRRSRSSINWSTVPPCSTG